MILSLRRTNPKNILTIFIFLIYIYIIYPSEYIETKDAKKKGDTISVNLAKKLIWMFKV